MPRTFESYHSTQKVYETETNAPMWTFIKGSVIRNLRMSFMFIQFVYTFTNENSVFLYILRHVRVRLYFVSLVSTMKITASTYAYIKTVMLQGGLKFTELRRTVK